MTEKKIAGPGGSAPGQGGRERDALLDALIAKRTGKRGRPSLDQIPGNERAAHPFTMHIARRVIREQVRLGGGRGSLSAAVKIVATSLGLEPESVRKYEQRHRRHVKDGEAWVANIEQAEASLQKALEHAGKSLDEIDRRMLGFPDDVRAALWGGGFSVGQVLGFLRENAIDGTCPRELIDWVRSPDFLSRK